MQFRFLLYLLAAISAFGTFSCSTFVKGSGKSKSVGVVQEGKLVSGRRFPFKGSNYRYFSSVSYALFNRAWVHEMVLKITLDAYKELEARENKSGHRFILMECSEKKGGRMWPHRTHQNGTSIDFASPLLKKGKPVTRKGLLHYAMKFDDQGILRSNKQVSIDFETMAHHILILDSIARDNGLYVKKVILKIDLKDDLFNTPSGKLLRRKQIYFAKSLPKMIDNVHDDHYHVDFGFLK